MANHDFGYYALSRSFQLNYEINFQSTRYSLKNKKKRDLINII